MTTRYSTALSHIVLAGTSIFCYIGARELPYTYPRCCFGIIIANSLIGTWRWGKYLHSCTDRKICTFYKKINYNWRIKLKIV